MKYTSLDSMTKIFGGGSVVSALIAGVSPRRPLEETHQSPRGACVAHISPPSPPMIPPVTIAGLRNRAKSAFFM